MELDITDFFNTTIPCDYSASMAELGRDAGRITWQAACDDAPDYPLLDTDEKRDAARAFFKDSGGWSEDEIAGWSDNELTALLIQYIAGDMREFNELAGGDWQEWAKLCEAGTCSGRLFGGPLSIDGRIYYTLD